MNNLSNIQVLITQMAGPYLVIVISDPAIAWPRTCHCILQEVDWLIFGKPGGSIRVLSGWRGTVQTAFPPSWGEVTEVLDCRSQGHWQISGQYQLFLDQIWYLFLCLAWTQYCLKALIILTDNIDIQLINRCCKSFGQCQYPKVLIRWARRCDLFSGLKRGL